MFPKTLIFSGTPLQLQRAVDILPEPKGRVRQRSSNSNSLREKLLQLEPDKLKQWKMKPAMLRLIPDLAVERENIALRERVLAITQGSLVNMEYRTLQRLIPFVWDDHDTRLAINAHFVRNPPTGSGWLAQQYKAFRNDDPALTIAESIPEGVRLLALHRHLGMHTANPLFQAICHRYCMAWSIEQVRTWSWPDLLKWLRSGYPRVIRVRVFQWLLLEYTTEQVQSSDLVDGTPLHQLLEVGLGIVTREDQLSMPEHQQVWLRQIHNGQLLQRWASRTIASEWSTWLRYIQALDIHRPSGWLFIHLSDFVVVHSMVHTGQEMLILTREVFRQTVVTLLRQPTPFSMSHIEQTMVMDSEWSERLTEWMLSQGYIPTTDEELS
jgi:hypothetical protein